ncbi:MAG TPA: hypothetical protein VFS00_22605, partial [Polyangiaceae bacterium]|nr:hypothetical protein [Polyangiaceae bacterium]
MVAPRNILPTTERSPRPRVAFVAAALLAAGLVAHCGGDADADGDGGGAGRGGDPCLDVYLDQCGRACTADEECADGLFCGAGTCKAQCTPDGGGCAAGVACSTRGRCLTGGAGSPGAGGGPGIG